jgi:hypothetical protein
MQRRRRYITTITWRGKKYMVVIVCGGSVHAYVYGTYYIVCSTMRMQNAATGSERECSCMIACTDKSLAEINLLACKPAKLEQYMLYCAYYIPIASRKETTAAVVSVQRQQ